jgi:hypothetical protein
VWRFLAIHAAYCLIISICCGGTVVLCVSSHAGATVLVEGYLGEGVLWKKGGEEEEEEEGWERENTTVLGS